MALIEEALYTRATTFTALQTLIGGRFYPLLAPDKPTKPYVVYQRISGARTESHDGSSGLANPRFQFSSWSEDFLEVIKVADQIRLAFHGYRATVQGVRLDTILFLGDLHHFENDTRLFRVISDFQVWHAEVKPS